MKLISLVVEYHQLNIKPVRNHTLAYIFFEKSGEYHYTKYPLLFRRQYLQLQAGKKGYSIQVIG